MEYYFNPLVIIKRGNLPTLYGFEKSVGCASNISGVHCHCLAHVFCPSFGAVHEATLKALHDGYIHASNESKSVTLCPRSGNSADKEASLLWSIDHRPNVGEFSCISVKQEKLCLRVVWCKGFDRISVE